MQFQQATSYISERLLKELPGYLSYHSVGHIKDVYQAAERIGEAEGIAGNDMALLLTAAMYHDCGFIIEGKDHEKISCDIAREHLPRFDYTPEQIGRVCGMIMATRVPQQPYNLLEEIICDADLDYLGRDDFFTIGDTLFAELKVTGVLNTAEEWNQLQIRFLEQHHYFTQTAINTRKKQKDEHLALQKTK